MLATPELSGETAREPGDKLPRLHSGHGGEGVTWAVSLACDALTPAEYDNMAMIDIDRELPSRRSGMLGG